MGDKAQDEMTPKEQHAPRLIQIERETKIPPQSESILIVATEAEGLVQVGPLLQWASTKA